MPQLDIFFFLPSAIFLFLTFFSLLFLCHYHFLPRISSLLKLRRLGRPRRRRPGARLIINIIGPDEVSLFLDDDLEPEDHVNLYFSPFQPLTQEWDS